MSSSSSAAVERVAQKSTSSSGKLLTTPLKRRSGATAKGRTQRRGRAASRRCRLIRGDVTAKPGKERVKSCTLSDAHQASQAGAKERVARHSLQPCVPEAQPAESGNASNGSTLTGLPGHLVERAYFTSGLDHHLAEEVDDARSSATLSSASTPTVNKAADTEARPVDENSSDEVCSPSREFIFKERKKMRSSVVVRFVARSYRRYEHKLHSSCCKSDSSEEVNREGGNQVDNSPVPDSSSHSVIPYLTNLDWEE